MKCFCVARPGMPLEKSEVMKYIRAHLDPYKRPRDVEMVTALPKNTLQKVLKRELLRLELEKRAGAVMAEPQADN